MGIGLVPAAAPPQLHGNPARTSYLFMGNYLTPGALSERSASGNRSLSMECICLLLAYKIKYPNTFHLLKGKSDYLGSATGSRLHGECLDRFGADVWDLLVEILELLCAASIIDDKVFCMHGVMSTFDHPLERAATINALERVSEIQMRRGGQQRKFRYEPSRRPRHRNGVRDLEAGHAVAEFRRKARASTRREASKQSRERVAKAVGQMLGQDLMGALVRLPPPMKQSEDLWATRTRRPEPSVESEARPRSSPSRPAP